MWDTSSAAVPADDADSDADGDADQQQPAFLPLTVYVLLLLGTAGAICYYTCVRRHSDISFRRTQPAVASQQMSRYGAV